MALTDTQQQILDGALSCIARDGLDGTSLRNVAEEAEVSLGLLGYHFDDRETLLAAAFELATDRLLETSLASLEGVFDPAERVEAFIRGAFDDAFLAPDYLALRISLWAIARTDDRIAQTEQKHYERYRDKIVALLATALPDVARGELEDRATDIIVTQNGLWLNWARHRSSQDLERGLQACVALARLEQ